MRDVLIVTNTSDARRAPGTERPGVWFALMPATQITTTFMTEYAGAGNRVVALVEGPGLDGAGHSTVLVDRTRPAGVADLPPLPPLFHLNLTEAISHARRQPGEEPLFVRAEYEDGTWAWKLHTGGQLREQIRQEENRTTGSRGQ